MNVVTGSTAYWIVASDGSSFLSEEGKVMRRLRFMKKPIKVVLPYTGGLTYVVLLGLFGLSALNGCGGGGGVVDEFDQAGHGGLGRGPGVGEDAVTSGRHAAEEGDVTGQGDGGCGGAGLPGVGTLGGEAINVGRGGLVQSIGAQAVDDEEDGAVGFGGWHGLTSAGPRVETHG